MDKQNGNFHIIANEDVWLEGDSIAQLEQVAKHPDCTQAVGMPDLHPGPGIPIGAAFAFANTVHPRLVGSDAGCGALVVALGKAKQTSSLERRLRAEFSAPPDWQVDTEELCESVWKSGASEFHQFDLPPLASTLADLVGPLSLPTSGTLPSPVFGNALGTIGGGNHFAKIGRVSDVIDKEAAATLGLAKGGLVLLCHSGSRGLGKSLSDHWGHEELPASEAAPYLAQLAGALRYAQANRILLATRLLGALGITRPSKVASAFDVVHNTVDREECDCGPLWVHRKGCAPAHQDQLAAVLGSRGTPSWIVRGLGNSQGLSSVAHGAGRKMKRSEAREKIRARYKRKELVKSKLGGMVICDDKKLLYEEHPDAYKDIKPVIQSLEDANMARAIASVVPLFTVKQ